MDEGDGHLERVFSRRVVLRIAYSYEWCRVRTNRIWRRTKGPEVFALKSGEVGWLPYWQNQRTFLEDSVAVMYKKV